MPSFGPGFINVETESGFPAATGRDFTSRLGRMVDLINTAAPVPERTLWFPPGEYRVLAPFTFPPKVILSFAPGARLVPIRAILSGDWMVGIAGVVEAPLQEIFAATSSGRIVFVGDGTLRVYPEWWGAARDPEVPDARADTAAIKAAFRAALIDREAPLMELRPPVTVCFLNDYHIDEPVVLAPPTGMGPLRAVSIAGSPGRKLKGQAQLMPWPLALLEIRRALRVDIRDLSLEAGGSWETCLTVSCDVSSDRQLHQVLLTDCSFSGARSTQVAISDLAMAPPLAGELAAIVRGCRFALDDIADTDLELPPVVDPQSIPVPLRGQGLSKAAGLSFRAGFGAELTVESGDFRGYFRRGVRVTGGVRTKVTACTFHFLDNPENLFPNGAAVALDRLGLPGALLPSLNAMGCVAMTPSFLWVDAPTAGEWQKSPEALERGMTVVLTSISHRVDRSRGLGLYWPPAVVWRGVRSPLHVTVNGNSTLTLIGCAFEVPVAAPLMPSASWRRDSKEPRKINLSISLVRNFV